MKIRTFPLTAAVMGSLLLCACSGDDGATGDKGDNGLSSLVNVTALNVGDANCPREVSVLRPD